MKFLVQAQWPLPLGYLLSKPKVTIYPVRLLSLLHCHFANVACSSNLVKFPVSLFPAFIVNELKITARRTISRSALLSYFSTADGRLRRATQSTFTSKWPIKISLCS